LPVGTPSEERNVGIKEGKVADETVIYQKTEVQEI
jgi:hypothetical protein